MGQSDKGSKKRCPSMRVKGRNGSIGFIRICSCGEQGERKLFRDFFLMLPLLLFLLWMNHCMHVAENPDASSDHYLQSTNLLLSFPIDVVGAALKPACVSKISIQRLNLDLRPRYIHVITSPPFRSGSNKISVTMTTKCDAFQRMENNLRCYEETQIVPSDVTLVATDEYLERKFGTKAYQSVRNKNMQTSGAKKNVAGWYLQEFQTTTEQRCCFCCCSFCIERGWTQSHPSRIRAMLSVSLW